MYVLSGATASINYCNIQGWSGALGGVGNTADNPVLVDRDGADNLPGTADDDARLAAGSPCIDSADSDALPGFVNQDLDGNERFVDDSATPNSGAGAITYLDRGAYEFAAPCPADTNASGSVDVDDLIAVILGWGPCPAPPTTCPADTDGSGEVDVDDLIAVILAWGDCP